VFVGPSRATGNDFRLLASSPPPPFFAGYSYVVFTHDVNKLAGLPN
jgi:hypothetical protein